MSRAAQNVLLWSPRILGILFAVFLGIFALDVFNEGFGFWKTLQALLVHLIPTWILLLVLIAAWRWPWIGGLGFLAAGVGYIFMARGRLDWIAGISGPSFLVGALFVASWLAGHPRRARA